MYAAITSYIIISSLIFHKYVLDNKKTNLNIKQDKSQSVIYTLYSVVKYIIQIDLGFCSEKNKLLNTMV